MKVFITASAGVGKSTVIHELKKRGYTAYDADNRELQLTRLEIMQTGEAVEWPKGEVDWSYYSWNADKARLEELLISDGTVFIAGILGNQEDLYDFFDKLIALTIDPEEHRRRLFTRPQREVGDGDVANQRRLDKYQYHMDKFIASGFVPVGNNESVDKTVDRILKIIRD